MNTVPVTAVRQFDYNGRTVVRGESLAMPPIDAAVHARKHNVSLTRRVQTRDLTAESTDGEPAPRKKRAYRRRDLTAEP